MSTSCSGLFQKSALSYKVCSCWPVISTNITVLLLHWSELLAIFRYDIVQVFVAWLVSLIMNQQATEYKIMLGFRTISADLHRYQFASVYTKVSLDGDRGPVPG